MQDLERLLAKVTMATAGPRELLALARSLAKIPALKKAIETARTSARLADVLRPAGRGGGGSRSRAGGHLPTSRR